MRLPARMDGVDSISRRELSCGSDSASEHQSDDNFSTFVHSRITITPRIFRHLAGVLLFLIASAAPAATSPVGATPGELEVTTRGSARYTISIVVPPGTREMQPKLSLVYDSQAGNGFIGHGWSLGGLSVIHRCGATILLDNFKGGVKYDANDKFCLDGERLVNVGGTEYRTRHETWQRIFASDASSNPASFTVYAKDGYILEFGVTEDSRIQAQGSTNVRVWALNKMTDRLGNYWTIQHQEDNANGDYRPDRIDYTGNAVQGLVPYNSMVFQYETRTDTSPRYEAGSVMKAMQRLSHVLSYTGTTLVRDYRLTYDNSGAVGRSRLANVQECGTDGVCLPATQFGWQNGAVGYATTPINSYWSTNKTADGPIGFADIDGDGQLDFWGWSSDGKIHVRRWGTNGFGPETSFDWSTNKTADGPVGFADVNGDGRADFWGWRSDGNINVRLSNGDGAFAAATTMLWSTAKDDSPIGFADIDGDGRADFYGANKLSNGALYGTPIDVVIKLSNGDGTFVDGVATRLSGGYDAAAGPTAYYYNRLGLSFTDVDGDGRTDLVGERDDSSYVSVTGTCPANGEALKYRTQRDNFVHLSSGGGSLGSEHVVMKRYQYFLTNGNPCGEESAPLGDVNGDGNADVFAWLSTGNGAFVAPPTSFFPTTGGSLPPAPGMADINGDGKDDYYYWDSSSGSIKARLSNGDNVFPTILSLPISTSLDNKPGFADIDGDGLADFYDWNSDGNIRVFLANSVMPDLIVSITNGLGEQRQFSYKPLTDDSIYSPALNEAYPYREIQDATYVVRTSSKSDGLGGFVSTNYAYAGQLKHVTANENLGFAWIQRAEPDGSWVNDYYNQDVDLFGTLRESQTYVPGPVLVKKTVNDWRLGTSSFNRILARLFSSTEETYELDGNLTTRAVTTTQYDGYGYPTSTEVLQLDGRKKTTVNTYFHDETYWTLGLKTLEQVTAEALGFTLETRTTQYSYYPGNGLLALETVEPTDSAYTLAKSYGYGVFGNCIRTTISGPGIAARDTTHIYDSTGRFRTRTTNALGHYETLEYGSRNGQPSKHTGPNGLITTWNYDGFGRKEKETRHDATTTIIDYAACDASCPPRAVTRFTTAATGASTSVSYGDALGREVQTAMRGLNGTWIYKSTVYDQLGRAAQVSLPYFSGEVPLYTISEYDALQRVKKVTAPGNRVTTTAYNGLSTTVTNSLIQPTTAVKDSEGHTVEVIDAAAGHTRSTYDAFGNLVQVTDPAGHNTTMRYDRLGRRIELNDPDRGRWTYGYNVLGELKSQTDAKLQTINMTYDLLGRMETRVLPGSEGTSTWTYDTAAYGKGKLQSVSNPGATETYVYDSLGRFSSTTTSISGITYTTSYTYDAYSRLLTLMYPVTGFKLYHVYDSYGHLTEVRKDSATGFRYWLIVSADAYGHPTWESLGNGLVSLHGYDRATSDLQTIKTYTFGSPSVQNSSYIYDALDNLTSRSWWDGAATRSETFGYDNLNRLTAVSGPVNRNIFYSSDGNISLKSGVGSYVYPSNGIRPHAVSSLAFIGTSYTYDANGNLTGVTGNGAKSIAYTSFNKPKTISNVSGTTALTYGASYHRVIKAAPGVTTTYIGKLYEKVENGTTTTHKHYIHAGGNLIAAYATVSNGTSNTRYFHTDHLGSIEIITNEGRNVMQRLSYDAWGKRRNPNGTDASSIAAQTTRGYTAHEHDDEAALINMKAREYDPLLARFLQPDPLGQQGDPHPYAYANNNSLKYTDPTGMLYEFGSYNNGMSYDYRSFDSSYLNRTYSNPVTSLNIAYNFNNSFNSIYSSSSSNWSSWNSSSSLSSFGSGGFSQTSFNTSWNSSGFGGYVPPQYTLGAGRSTGTPSTSFWDNVPIVGAFRQAASGNLGSAVGSMALDFASVFAPTRLFGVAADVGRVAKPSTVAVIGRRWDTAVAKDWPGHEVFDIPKWSMPKNDAWVQSVINRRMDVYLGSNATSENLFRKNGAETVFGREYRQFLDAEYSPFGFDMLIAPP